MLTNEHRFHGHGSLRYVYKNGTAVRSSMMTIKYTSNPRRRHSRFSVVISKKVLKSAVGRNLVRRRVYEVVRHELPNLRAAHDIVILVFSSELISLPHDELTTLVQQLLTQAELYK